MVTYAVPGESGTYRGKDYDGIDSYERDVNENNLQLFGLTLCKATLQDAQRAIGQSPIAKQEYTNGRFDTQLCYSGEKARFILETANRRLRDSPDRINALVLTNEKKVDELYATCTPTKVLTKDIFIAGGLKLGMSTAEVIKIWGKPSKSAPGVIIYRIRRITQEYFTDDINIYTEFKNGKLTYISMSRMVFH